MRKIIQITSSSVVGGWLLTALCDDGTLWWRDNTYGEWQQLPNVSQGIVPTGAWTRS